jgi:MYXO-CTERM domain-containing protein
VEVEGPRATFTAKRVDSSVMDQFTVGTGWNECAAAPECASRSEGACLADEEGSWVCLHGACVWSCTARGAPDGGLPGADGSVGGDGGPGGPDGGGPGVDDHGGCGCDAGARGGSPLGLLLFFLLYGRRRRWPAGRPRR